MRRDWTLKNLTGCSGSRPTYSRFGYDRVPLAKKLEINTLPIWNIEGAIFFEKTQIKIAFKL